MLRIRMIMLDLPNKQIDIVMSIRTRRKIMKSMYAILKNCLVDVVIS